MSVNELVNSVLDARLAYQVAKDGGIGVAAAKERLQNELWNHADALIGCADALHAANKRIEELNAELAMYESSLAAAEKKLREMDSPKKKN